jgi:hypothetical protein
MGPAEQSTWLPRGEERAAAGMSGAWTLQNRTGGYPGVRRSSNRLSSGSCRAGHVVVSVPRGDEKQQQASQVHGFSRTEHYSGAKRDSSRLLITFLRFISDGKVDNAAATVLSAKSSVLQLCTLCLSEWFHNCVFGCLTEADPGD